MNLTQYFSRLLTQLSKCVVFWCNYFPRIDSTMFQPNSSRHQVINMPSTAAHFLTKKNMSYLKHLCTQPPPINTTAPELTALPIHLWLLLVIIILLPLAENECLKSSHLIRSINNPVSSQDLTCKGKKLSANKFNRTWEMDCGVIMSNWTNFNSNFSWAPSLQTQSQS